ncbi:MAG: ribosome maturation factor RimP [Aeromicrobium sp.]
MAEQHLPPTSVTGLVEQCVAELGLDLDAVELRGSGPKRVLRVVVDKDGGVPLGVITETSRELSSELDRSDVMGATGYTLEVTSRGIDRPLTLPRHWIRNVGRLVVVTTAEDERVRGRIATATAEHVELDDGRQLAFADVKSAHIKPELNRPKAGPASERNT